jgi:hypothetical protein
MSNPRTTLRNRTIISDPGDEQTHLFAPDTTLPPTCKCGCTRKNLCPIDAAIANGGTDKWAKRPRTCLARIGQTDLPEGF